MNLYLSLVDLYNMKLWIYQNSAVTAVKLKVSYSIEITHISWILKPLSNQ